MFESFRGVDDTEAAAVIALLTLRPDNLSWSDITAELVESGNAASVWAAHWTPDLLQLSEEDDPVASALQRVTQWRSEGFRLLTILDEDYPDRLRGIHQAPPVLFAQGDLRSDDPAVSVVGSRLASPDGLALACDIATALSNEGVTVLSGLAAGIDAASHRAALDAGGRTVAFIGTGIRRHYPAENRDLQEEIVRRGLVLSQFWPDAPPRKQHFPMRNAAMSGYGLATVVVEAGEYSGARIQARVAVEHGRPVILSELVVQRTKWGKDMLGRPDVFMANSVGKVMDVLGQLDRRRALLNEEFVRLCAV